MGLPYRAQLCLRLTPQLAAAVLALDAGAAAGLEEIRVYAGCRACLVIGGKDVKTDVIMSPGGMNDLLSALCGHALYSCEAQLSQGYLPLAGGHRAGVCGSMARQSDGTWRMGAVSSVCIRVCHAVPGASRPIRPYLLDHAGGAARVLLLGAPGCGKTTVLRDAALYLSGLGMHVAVADERQELFPPGRETQKLDVLSGVDKAEAFSMLLRAMAPQVMVTDEIGRAQDVDALLDAVRCGAGVLASAHARSLEEAARRPAIQNLMAERAFDRYILLGYHGCVLAVCDGAGSREGKEECTNGQLGCGRDGDDRDQRHRLSAFGR